MISVGTYEAKTHLPQLLGRVEKGERIFISRRGKVIAMLVSVPESSGLSVVKAIQKLKLLRAHTTLGRRLSIKKLVEQGRRL